jgi:predicted Zn finger-like uncharacterized protein
MLFTRCPDCDTTFRVTDDALQKANGQVRCGRCASVFNAYAERRDAPPDVEPPDGAASDEAQRDPLPAPAPAAAPVAPPPRPGELASHAAPHGDGEAADAASGAEAAPDTDSAPDAPSTESFDALSVADVVAQVELAANDEDPASDETETGAADRDITPSEVHAVLAGEGDAHDVADDEAAATRWPLGAPAPRNTRWWSAGAALALVLLALQTVNHYRAELASNTTVGAFVQRAYALLGTEVVPHWDIRQYQILDWIATAEPNTRGQGSLRITARIKNLGPKYQPYPSVHLRLKDRWEVAVGSRVFAPAEYLAPPPSKLMAPGETTRAEIEVVDPGQDAYGFELDVCIEVETRVLSCGSDKVFL